MAKSLNLILNELQTLQATAFSRNIDFGLDLYFNAKGEPGINVSLFYSQTGEETETHTLTTRFADNAAQNTIRLKKVQDFINKVSY